MGKPLQGVRVEIRDPDTGELKAVKYTDAEGNAQFSLIPGRYKVVASKPGYSPHEQILELTESYTKNIKLTPYPTEYASAVYGLAVLDRLSALKSGIYSARALYGLAASDKLEHELTPLVGPSGLDPNDPEWAPAEGWTDIWQFTAEDELDDYVKEGNYKNARVENSLAILDTTVNDNAWLKRINTQQCCRRVAICLHYEIFQHESDYETIDIHLRDGSKDIWAKMRAIPSVDKFYAWDNNYGQTCEFPFSDETEWMVIVVDFADGYWKVYGKTKQILCEFPLNKYDTSELEEFISIFALYSEKYGLINNIWIDWIAVRYE